VGAEKQTADKQVVSSPLRVWGQDYLFACKLARVAVLASCSSAKF